MVRPITVYEPEERRHTENNLFCTHCGNTHQFNMDLKLRHQVEVLAQGLTVQLEENQTGKVLKAIQDNLQKMVDKALDRDKDVFICANCEGGMLDFHERVLESCQWTGCPGCWFCGEWMEKEDVLEMCSECITANNGDINEDDCFSLCEHYDFGLQEVWLHYGITFQSLKADLGY